MLIGVSSFKVVSLLYTYLFFYFAAGCYYKQQILWDRHIFVAAGVRFLVAIGLFITSIVMATLVINSGIYFLRVCFPVQGTFVLDELLGSVIWLLAKYAFIFILFILFFMVPSFAFVSEITGKNRSMLTTYAKTKGNLLKIGGVALLALILLLVAMVVLSQAHFLLVSIVRAGILVFISILYFKMYDFFYGLAQNKREKKTDKVPELKESNTLEKKTKPNLKTTGENNAH